jgi:hypothetical protein
MTNAQRRLRQALRQSRTECGTRRHAQPVVRFDNEPPRSAHVPGVSLVPFLVGTGNELGQARGPRDAETAI